MLLSLFLTLACFVYAGQLQDLMHILDESGMPTAKQKYLFNGDFVDRGKCGVEVMLLILTLFLAFPGLYSRNF
jgi:hypothetical protein